MSLQQILMRSEIQLQISLLACDGTMIVAMVTLQEPYFPKHVFSYINLENLVLFLEYASIFVIDRAQYENVL